MKVLALYLVLLSCAVCSEGIVLLLLKKKFIKHLPDLIDAIHGGKATHVDLHAPSAPALPAPLYAPPSAIVDVSPVHLPALKFPEIKPLPIPIPFPKLTPVFKPISIPVPKLTPVIAPIPLPILEPQFLQVSAPIKEPSGGLHDKLTNFGALLLDNAPELPIKPVGVVDSPYHH